MRAFFLLLLVVISVLSSSALEADDDLIVVDSLNRKQRRHQQDSTVETVFTCPEDYELVSATNTCVKRLPPQEVCPAGFTLYPSRLSGSGSEDRYRKNSLLCIKEDVKPPVEFCNHKVRNLAKHHADGDDSSVSPCQDVRHSLPGQASCDLDRGFIISGNGRTCLKRDTASPSLRCVEGDLVDGSRCERAIAIPGTVKCVDDFFLHGDGKTCQRILKERQDMRCPVSYQEHSGGCEKHIHASVEFFCDMGYVLVGGSCTTKETRSIEYFCAEKNSRLDGNICIVDEYVATDSCPEGLRVGVDGKKCVKYIDREADHSCLLGQFDLFHDACVELRESGTDSLVCPRGAHKHGKKCMRHEYAEKAETCELNGVLVDGKEHGTKKCRVCTGSTQIDIDHHTTGGGGSTAHAHDVEQNVAIEEMVDDEQQVLMQDDTFSYSSNSSQDASSQSFSKLFNKHHGGNGGMSKKHNKHFVKTPSCMDRPAVVNCPDGFQENARYNSEKQIVSSLSGSKKPCLKKVIVTGQTECSNGYFLHKGKCVKKEIRDPVADCDDGFTLTEGVCRKAVETDLQCRDGYSFVVEKELCKGISHQSAQSGCPADYERQGNSCTIDKRIPPRLDCPRGFILEIHEHQQNGVQQCVKIMNVPPISTCPSEDYQLDGEFCLKTEYQHPKVECPEGAFFPTISAESGGSTSASSICSKQVVTSPVTQCPESFYLEEDGQKMCVHTSEEPPKISCPDGYIAEEGECRFYERSDQFYRCPDGYEQQESRNYNDNKAVSNTRKNDNFICVKQFTADPILACPAGSFGDKDGWSCIADTRTATTISNPQKRRHPHNDSVGRVHQTRGAMMTNDELEESIKIQHEEIDEMPLDDDKNASSIETENSFVRGHQEEDHDDEPLEKDQDEFSFDSEKEHFQLEDQEP
eukprot:TRINITY_DN34981_c1_g1_i2.p1 TRINITY_DN34981_c1_g1~~TRINITY_DN34981_c1_g1_i2.p1  ORF type:complete len:959 (-),score=125.03 TRINITY_DN34981_c1_g1_i2:123-2876(-)